MKKYLCVLILTVPFFLTGCTKIKITPMMCNKIRQNPNETLPQQCIEYNKKQVNKDWYGNHTSSKPPKEILKVDQGQ